MFCWRRKCRCNHRRQLIFPGSRACYALFSECDLHASAWSSFTSCSPLLPLFSEFVRKTQLIKPLSHFQFSSLSVIEAHLQLVWLTSLCFCVHICVNVKEPPRQSMLAASEAQLSAPTHPLPLHPLPLPSEHCFHSSRGVAYLYQTAYGVWPSCHCLCRSSPLWGVWQSNLCGLMDVFLKVWLILFFCCCCFVLFFYTSHCPFSIVVLHVHSWTVSSISDLETNSSPSRIEFGTTIRVPL